MAYTQADLDAIKDAIKEGALRVEFPGGGSTTYRSLDEMKRIQADIQREVNASNGQKPKSRQIRFISTKDL